MPTEETNEFNMAYEEATTKQEVTADTTQAATLNEASTGVKDAPPSSATSTTSTTTKTETPGSSTASEAPATSDSTSATSKPAEISTAAKIDTAAVPDPSKKNYSIDPALYIYTSLTAGSSHIVTATSRLETILRANRVPFKAIDLATDQKARMLWGRRAGKDAAGRVRKLPGLVQMGLILGDLVEIEEWNEYGELKQHVTIFYDEFTQPPIGSKPPVPKITRRKATPVAAAAAAAGAAKATTLTSATKAAAPPPEAPPLPGTTGGVKEAESAAARDKAKPAEGSAISDNTAKPTTAKSVSAATSVAAPTKSVAEEAAAKARKVRLQALRNKVAADASKRQAADSNTEESAASSNVAEAELQGDDQTATELSIANFGMQSPANGAWQGTMDEMATTTAFQSWKTRGWHPLESQAQKEAQADLPVRSKAAQATEIVEQKDPEDGIQQPQDCA